MNFKKYLHFWEKIKWYDVSMLNEREVRAAAWILFVFALPIFLISCMNMDFLAIRVFVTIFMLDFFIRTFINPSFSPSMILWKIVTSNQKVDYVWAPQKRFAWAVWFFLSLIMFFSTVVFNFFGLPVILLCFFCLILLFLESSFWICLWCNLYNKFNKEKAKYCQWWTCEIIKKEEIQKVNIFQISIIILFILIIIWVSNASYLKKESSSSLCTEWCWIGSQTNSFIENIKIPTPCGK